MNNTRNTLIAIIGATASGKTSLSIELAKKLDAEIISADSRQVYKYMDIGTAKVSNEEMQCIKHHFVDFLFPDMLYSAGRFADEARLLINDMFTQRKTPILVGGSGLYVQALCEGFFPEDTNPKALEIREELNKRLENEGIESIIEDLKKVDEEALIKYSDKNPRRLLRALEFYYTYNTKFSDNINTFNSNNDFDVIYYEIEHSREELYSRINHRTELMWQMGIVQETKEILNMGYSADLNALNTVGYKECIQFLNNQITEEKAIELIAQNTRRYAKRQLTWFKKYAPSIKLNSSINEMLNQILSAQK